MIHLRNLFVCILTFYVISAHGVEVVRIDIQADNLIYSVDLELFDDITPVTVNNFLRYVEEVPDVPGGRYDKSFIHRSLDDFVLQGGGYTFDPFVGTGGFVFDSMNNIYSGGLQRVEAFSPIVNEFQGSNLSNTRGTIAMAKSPSNPDSATSQWFINLGDNSKNLDQQNEGFTVFGRVLDNGMDVLDIISVIPVFNITTIHPVFTDIPLASYVPGDTILQDNLVYLKSVRKIQRPILEVNSDVIDFGIVPIGQIATKSITLKNTGNADLVMDSSSIAQLVAPFNISYEDCSNRTLTPVSPIKTDFCTVTIEFSPSIVLVHETELRIKPAINPYGLNFTLDIIAEGVPSTPVLYLEGEFTTLDFSDVALFSQTTNSIVIQNRGGGVLLFSPFILSGQDASLFSLDNGCTSSTVLLTGETCTLDVIIEPDTEGLKLASLSINTNADIVDLLLRGNSLGASIDVISDLYFGETSIGTVTPNGVIVGNVGIADLIISDVTLIDGDIDDFTIDASNCSSNIIAGRECIILIDAVPKSVGVKLATLAIISNDPNNTIVYISLSAEALSADIDTVSEVFIGTAQINGQPIYHQFQVVNKGEGPLQFTSMNISGLDADAFAVGNDCPGISSAINQLPLKFNETCTIAIQFSAKYQGLHIGRLELNSNDPDEGVYSIALSAYGDLDADSITTLEEDNAPNLGDGNNDNIKDSIQNNVVSFVSDAGEYITMISPDGTYIYDVSVLKKLGLTSSPSNIQYDHGIFQFSILTSGTAPGVVVQVGVVMPVGDQSGQFYKYGATPENPELHWYDYEYNGRTGAQFLGKVSIAPEDGGAMITRNMFILSYIDGERGDDDLTLNGKIVNAGAPVIIKNDASEESTGTISWLLLSILNLIYLRYFYYRLKFSKSN